MRQYLFTFSGAKGTHENFIVPVGTNPSKTWKIPGGIDYGFDPIVCQTPLAKSGTSDVRGQFQSPMDSELMTTKGGFNTKTMPVVFLRRFRIYNPLLTFYWEMQGSGNSQLNYGLLKFYRGAYTPVGVQTDISKQRGIFYGSQLPFSEQYPVRTRYLGNEWIDINNFLPSNYLYNKSICLGNLYDMLCLATKDIYLIFDKAFDNTIASDNVTVGLTRIELEVNTNKNLL